MYANKHIYTIDERARFRGPLWHLADEQEYRPIVSYKSHRLLKRKKKMYIGEYRCNRKIPKFSLHNRRI